MTDFARLVLASDTTGLTSAQRELRNLTSAGGQAERRVTQATGMMDKGFRAVALSAARMGGALAGAFLSGRWLVGAIRDSEELERTMLRTQAIIQATGGVAGRSAEQLKRQADELARATLADERHLLRVQQQLLTFRNIRGEVFDDAVTAALDLSEAMGTDLSSAALQVARALEDPVRGVTALTRSGTVFTQAQRDMIRAMVDAGNVAGAQRLILQELENQYGGAAEAAAQGLAGSVDTLRQNMRDMGRAMVENFGLMDATQSGVELLSRAAGALGENMDIVRIAALGAGGVVLGMYTPAIVGATGATLGWIASLITLRGVLITTGIGTLIVLVGTTLDFLIRLRTATGSWGESLSLLGDVAREVFGRMPDLVGAAVNGISAWWHFMRADFLSALNDMSEDLRKWVRSIADVFAVIPGMQTMSVSLRQFANIEGLETTIRQLEDMGTAAHNTSQNMMAAATRPLQSIHRLNAALKTTTDDTTEAADAARRLADELDEIGGTAGGGGGVAARAADGIDETAEAAGRLEGAGKRIEGMFASTFSAIITGSQSAGQALSRLLSQLADILAQQAFRSLVGGIFSGGGGVGGGSGLLGMGGFLGFLDSGGTVGPDEWAVAGERGAEIVRGPAHVTSRAETARIMQGQAAGGTAKVQLEVFVNDDGRLGAIARQEGAAAAFPVAVTITQRAMREQRRGLRGQLQAVEARGA